MFEVPRIEAVKFMVRTFGYPPGAYTGPYPTEAEAIKAVESATTVPAEEFDNRMLVLDGKRYPIERVDSRLMPIEYAQQSPGPITAVLWQGECLIVNIPEPQPLGWRRSWIFLIDAKTGKPFARYQEPGLLTP